jgi:hypothetical protein
MPPANRPRRRSFLRFENEDDDEGEDDFRRSSADILSARQAGSLRYIFGGITHEPVGSPRRMKIVLVVVLALVVGRF